MEAHKIRGKARKILTNGGLVFINVKVIIQTSNMIMTM